MSGEKELSCGETTPGSTLHHDNAPAHASLLMRDFLTNMNTSVLPLPPYSPDLAPADFFLFPKLKSNLKGR
jgi:histone-lysine N-methyltransferase SETMAR